jgi:hypothetical protein
MHEITRYFINKHSYKLEHRHIGSTGKPRMRIYTYIYHFKTNSTLHTNIIARRRNSKVV